MAVRFACNQERKSHYRPERSVNIIGQTVDRVGAFRAPAAAVVPEQAVEASVTQRVGNVKVLFGAWDSVQHEDAGRFAVLVFECRREEATKQSLALRLDVHTTDIGRNSRR